MIYGKVGNLGHGKTLRMVVDGIDLATLRGGREGKCWLASNIQVNVPDGIRFVQLPMDGFSVSLSALMRAARERETGLVVLLDEIDTIWDAHEWQDMRKSDRYRIKQSRKFGADLIWSAQFVDQVEKSVRNITTEVELVRAYPAPSIRRREKGRRPWLIRGQRFRPGAVRELIGTPDKDRRLGTSLHLYRRAHEGLYDTDELVMPPDSDLERLCARHRKERSEAQCPDPEHGNPPADSRLPLGLSEFIMAAREEALNESEPVV